MGLRARTSQSTPCAVSPRLEITTGAAQDFGRDDVLAGDLPAARWNTQEWLEFLRVLPRPLTARKLEELDHAWNLTNIGNYEILDEWLLMAIESGYEPAFPRLERFLLEIGRMKLLKPLYAALMKTEDGKVLAHDIYRRAHAGYHAITRTAIEKILLLQIETARKQRVYSRGIEAANRVARRAHQRISKQIEAGVVQHRNAGGLARRGQQRVVQRILRLVAPCGRGSDRAPDVAARKSSRCSGRTLPTVAR